MGQRSSPTSHDVARLAGVDRSTVSIVLNDPQTRRITAATKQRVLDAAASLGYAPNAAASQLRAGGSKTILIPLPSLAFDAVSEAFVRGVVEGADLHGRQLLIHGSTSPAGPAAARAWARLRPEVLIATADSLSKEGVEILLTAGVEVVVRLGARDAWGAHGVDYRPADAARLAAQRLSALGADDLVVVARSDRLLGRERDLVDAFRDAVSPRPVELAALDPDGSDLGERMRSQSARGGRLGLFALDDELSVPIRLRAMEAALDPQPALVVLGARPAPGAAPLPYSTVGFDPAALGRQVVAAAVDIVEGRAGAMPQADYDLYLGSEHEVGLDRDVTAGATTPADAAATVDHGPAAPRRHRRGTATGAARRAGSSGRAVHTDAPTTVDGATEHARATESFDSVAERVQQRRKSRREPGSTDEQA